MLEEAFRAIKSEVKKLAKSTMDESN